MLGLSHSCHGHIIRVMLSAQLRYRCSIRTVLLAMFKNIYIFKCFYLFIFFAGGGGGWALTRPGPGARGFLICPCISVRTQNKNNGRFCTTLSCQFKLDRFL